MTRTRTSKNTIVTFRHDAVYLALINPNCEYWKPEVWGPNTMPGHVTYMMLGLLGQTMPKGDLISKVTKFVENAPTSGSRGGVRFDVTAARIVSRMIDDGLIVVH